MFNSKEWIEAMNKVKSKLVEVQKVQDDTMMCKKMADDTMPNSASAGVQKVCLSHLLCNIYLLTAIQSSVS